MKRINLDEKYFREFVKSGAMVVMGEGFVRFTSWYDRIVLERTVDNGYEDCEIYINDVKVNMEPILYQLQFKKACINTMGINEVEENKAEGVKRRMDIVLEELIDAAILKTKVDSSTTVEAVVRE